MGSVAVEEVRLAQARAGHGNVHWGFSSLLSLLTAVATLLTAVVLSAAASTILLPAASTFPLSPATVFETSSGNREIFEGSRNSVSLGGGNRGAHLVGVGWLFRQRGDLPVGLLCQGAEIGEVVLCELNSKGGRKAAKEEAGEQPDLFFARVH